MDQTPCSDDTHDSADGDLRFAVGDDCGRIVVSSAATGGASSVMEWTVAPAADSESGFGPHAHGALEETFLVRAGELEFLLGDDVTTISAGDFICVPAGVRHGYRNRTGKPVDLLVTFVPGGFEELFVRYRTDQAGEVDPDGFVADATRDFQTVFE